jgi:hypothetical protein
MESKRVELIDVESRMVAPKTRGIAGKSQSVDTRVLNFS